MCLCSRLFGYVGTDTGVEFTSQLLSRSKERRPSLLLLEHAVSTAMAREHWISQLLLNKLIDVAGVGERGQEVPALVLCTHLALMDLHVEKPSHLLHLFSLHRSLADRAQRQLRTNLHLANMSKIANGMEEAVTPRTFAAKSPRHKRVYVSEVPETVSNQLDSVVSTLPELHSAVRLLAPNIQPLSKELSRLTPSQHDLHEAISKLLLHFERLNEEAYHTFFGSLLPYLSQELQPFLQRLTAFFDTLQPALIATHSLYSSATPILLLLQPHLNRAEPFLQQLLPSFTSVLQGCVATQSQQHNVKPLLHRIQYTLQHVHALFHSLSELLRQMEANSLFPQYTQQTRQLQHSITQSITTFEPQLARHLPFLQQIGTLYIAQLLPLLELLMPYVLPGKRAGHASAQGSRQPSRPGSGHHKRERSLKDHIAVHGSPALGSSAFLTPVPPSAEAPSDLGARSKRNSVNNALLDPRLLAQSGTAIAAGSGSRRGSFRNVDNSDMIPAAHHDQQHDLSAMTGSFKAKRKQQLDA